MAERHFLSIDDLDAGEIAELLSSAGTTKQDRSTWATELEGRQVALIFEKPSTRTRVSFEVAVTSMGGSAVVLRSDELQLGRGETIEDTARVLSRYVDAIVVRTFEQERLERLASTASVPVINALSDLEHPCQALADFMTMQESFSELRGLALSYVGDGNNVAHSLMLGGAELGMDVRIATPKGYEPAGEIQTRARDRAARTGGRLTVTNVVAEAAEGADVLYTDVWASMGQEDSADSRREAFARYQVNDDVMAMAKTSAIAMHCLPAHRGEEISASVIDGDRSVVWEQAENRLYVQKALLRLLIG